MSTALVTTSVPEMLSAFALAEILQITHQAARKRLDALPRSTDQRGLIVWRSDLLPADWRHRIELAKRIKGCDTVDELLTCRRHSAAQFAFSIDQATDYEKQMWPHRKAAILEYYRVEGFTGCKEEAKRRACALYQQLSRMPVSPRNISRWLKPVVKCGGPEHAPDEAYVHWGKRRTLPGPPRETIEYFGTLVSENQRKFAPAWKKLVERLRLWRETGDKQYRIPGYSEPPKNDAGRDLPPRWSYQYFIDRRRRPSAPVIAGARYGLAAIKDLNPVVRTSRIGVKVGAIYYPDDNIYDVPVNVLGINTRETRPLGLNCIDHASACIFASFFKPTVWDDEDRAKRMLKQRDMIWFHVHLLTHSGFRTDANGTEIHAEKGTAGYPQWLIDNTKLVTGDKVKIRSGAIGGQPVFDGLFEGAAKGNPRFKSLMEGAFNPIRNRMADLEMFPGAVGKDRDHAPEDGYGRSRYNRLLLKVWAGLSEPDRAKLIFPYKEWRDFGSLAMSVIEAINCDLDHDCADWAACGYTTQEWRHDDDAPWKSIAEYLDMPGDKRAALESYLACNPHYTRVRKLSRREVYAAGAQDLTRIPSWSIPQLLTHQDAPDLSVMRRVNADGQFEFQDADADPYGGKFLFLARVHDRQGHEVLLTRGEKYKTFLNPLDPSELIVCQPNGAFIGECPALDRPAATDQQGIHKLLGTHNKLTREAQTDLTRLGIERTRELAAMKMNNEGVVAGRKTDRAKQMEEATDDVANAIYG
jgi:hypothetical protein